MEFYALWVNRLVSYPAFLLSALRQQPQLTITGKQHCVTVRIGLGHGLYAQHAAGPDAVIDDHVGARVLLMALAMTRGSRSVGPPGANPTTIVTDLPG